MTPVRCALHGFGTREREADHCDFAESGFPRCVGSCGMAAIVAVSVSRGIAKPNDEDPTEGSES